MTDDENTHDEEKRTYNKALLMHTLADMVGASVLIESGVGEAGSTRAACAWARAGESGQRHVIAIEREELPERTVSALRTACGGGILQFHAGDAFDVLDTLLKSLSAKNVTVALFIDGPKGRVAVRLARHVLDNFDCVRVVALHDVPRLDPRYRDAHGRHLARAAMEKVPAAQVYSDEEWFVNRFAKQIDGHSVLSRQGEAGFAASNVTGSYGPTLGAFVRGWRQS
eukprot:TRINITY_DN66223_c0_g1_i1.p1 TRINITY_DN66223_c0_g1~~TRINITY_DN66223_c0_g1_i1.p1  ORF type:complete len:226 (+),score=44.66 TRINITY_DN66223_c0_g1_i1:121-798(+)